MATDMNDSSENKPRPPIVGATLVVAHPRYRATTPRHSGGGRNPVPGSCWLMPTPFSFQAVPVATGMNDCHENKPRPPIVGATLVVARPRHRATTPSFPRKNVTPYYDTGRESNLSPAGGEIQRGGLRYPTHRDCSYRMRKDLPPPVHAEPVEA